MPFLPLTNDPRDLLLGPDNDLVITDDLAFSRGIGAVVQDCRIALQIFAGEWFLDLDVGIPYWQSILGFKPAIAIKAAQIAFRRELLLVPGVMEILKLDIGYAGSTRTMTIQWQVQTGLGETPVDTIALSTGGA